MPSQYYVVDDEYFKNLPKPWTKEDCELRFVFGTKISNSDLAEASGLPKWKIDDLSSLHNWKGKRKDFSQQLDQKVAIKVIEKQSEKLSEMLSDVELQHAESFARVRRIADKYFIKLEEKIADCDDADELLEHLKPATFNLINMTLKRSIDGERQALHLDLTDINVAFKVIENAGMRVLVPGSNDEEEPKKE